MKRILLLILGWGEALFFTGHTWAQAVPAPKKDSITRLFRIYEDDDYINFWGNGTDNAYTNGTRLDYFYQPSKRPRGILGRWAPAAGDSSTDIYGWGIMQLMYTPNDLTRTDWQPSDYQYAGALVAMHSRYSYNPVKKYAFQTELVMGVLGPAALARETQTSFHRIIHYTLPRGWGHQFRNDVLLNVNITAEKQMAAASRWLTLIGGAQVSAGTMQNGAALYSTLLIGRMNPYFNGLFSQYTAEKKKWQIYFLLKPELQFFYQNALLEGGMFTHDPNIPQIKKPGEPPATGNPPLQAWVPSVTYGFVLSHGNVGFSLTEDVSSTTLQKMYCHDVGNISLYFGW